MRITLEQFCEQWAPKGNGRYLPNKMEFNTHDFVTMAGEYSKSRFRTSFAEGGLYGSGKLWPERKSRWGRRFTHPVMNDTGNLSRSIFGEAERMDRTNLTQRAYGERKKIFRRPEHRQFIGISPKLNHTVNQLFIPILFRGFPFPNP